MAMVTTTTAMVIAIKLNSFLLEFGNYNEAVKVGCLKMNEICLRWF